MIFFKKVKLSFKKGSTLKHVFWINVKRLHRIRNQINMYSCVSECTYVCNACSTMFPKLKRTIAIIASAFVLKLTKIFIVFAIFDFNFAKQMHLFSLHFVLLSKTESGKSKSFIGKTWDIFPYICNFCPM